MTETTATDRNIEIKVKLHAAAIYWYFLKALTSFPSLPLLLGPISVVAYYEAQAGQGFYNSIGLGVFMFVLMPWGFIFLGYRNTLLKFPVRHIFSNSGIATALPTTSAFVEWSWVKTATENRKYILIMLKNGFVLLPKNQLSEDELASVRTCVSQHLGRKAHLAANSK